MKFSVIMTVYNRPQLALMNTLSKLGANDFSDGEVIIVDDGSTLPYEPLVSTFADHIPIRWERVDTVADREGTYNIDGHNNPAYAANCGLEMAKGEFIFWMSSDVMLPPQIIHRAFDLNLEQVAWMPCVVDLDTNQTYLGPDRMVPLGWFYGVHRKHLEEIGGWDEEYLKGIAFEDNDIMCRLGHQVGRFVIDKQVVAWHQSHPQTAYSDELAGWNLNQKYTLEKHGSIPFNAGCPLEKQLTEINHQMILDMKMRSLLVKP